MTAIRKTITVTDTQNAWIKSQVESGRFTNDSEYIRNLLREDREQRQNIETLRQALIDGENSGEAVEFDLDAFKANMRKRMEKRLG